VRAAVVALCFLPLAALAQEDEGVHLLEPSDAGVEPAELADGGAAARAEPVEAAPIEEFQPVAPVPAVESFASAPAGPEVRFSARVGAELGLDTRFESPRGAPLAENVVEGRVRLALGVDVKLFDWLRVVLEGRAQLRGAAQQGMDRFKGFFEPMLGDAFVDLYLPKVDLRLGNQRIPLGANAAFAPSDVLNPKDLRESFLRGEPEDAVLPVFALRAKGELGKVEWLLAYAPFFTPNKYAVIGQDEALLQPPLAAAFDTSQLSPTVEDAVQSRLIETEQPVPFAGDVAVHLAIPARVKVGATWAWVNEKLPRVEMDPELQAAFDARAAGRQADPAVLASLASRLEAGEQLYKGYYLRQHVFALQGSMLAGPVQLDADVAYSPRVTFIDPAMKPLSKPTLNWTLGVSQASDFPLKFAVTYVGMVAFDVKAQEQLALVEPATAVGAPRVAWLHLFVGGASYPVWKDRFLLELRAAFEVVQKSFAIAPKVTFQGVDGLSIWVTAEFYEGSSYSPLGYFGRNDKVVVGFDWRPF
jgi:hypothetical protein